MDRRKIILSIHDEMRQRNLLVNDKKTKRLKKQAIEKAAREKAEAIERERREREEAEAFRLKQQRLQQEQLQSSRKKLVFDRTSVADLRVPQLPRDTKSETSSGVHSETESKLSREAKQQQLREQVTRPKHTLAPTSKQTLHQSHSNEHRIVRQPISLRNTTSAPEPKPKINELRSLFESAKPKPLTRSSRTAHVGHAPGLATIQLQSSHARGMGPPPDLPGHVIYENPDGLYFTLPENFEFPNGFVLPYGFTPRPARKRHKSGYGHEKTKNYDLYERPHHGQSRTSFSDSEESYSGKFARQRIAKLKEKERQLRRTGATLAETENKLQEYVSMLENRRTKIEELHEDLKYRRDNVKAKEREIRHFEQQVVTREHELDRRHGRDRGRPGHRERKTDRRHREKDEVYARRHPRNYSPYADKTYDRPNRSKSSESSRDRHRRRKSPGDHSSKRRGDRSRDGILDGDKRRVYDRSRDRKQHRSRGDKSRERPNKERANPRKQRENAYQNPRIFEQPRRREANNSSRHNKAIESHYQNSSRNHEPIYGAHGTRPGRQQRSSSADGQCSRRRKASNERRALPREPFDCAGAVSRLHGETKYERMMRERMYGPTV